METLQQPTPGPPPVPDKSSAEARGLFAAGWYATRDESRVVHPADQIELLVSVEVWRALRVLESAGDIQPTAPTVA